MPSILPALRALLFASALVPMLLLAGCGLKGDLYLPEPGDASRSPPENADDTDDDTDDEDWQRPGLDDK